MQEAWCSQIYRMIREGVDAGSLRLGVGRNLYPPCAAVSRHLLQLMRDSIRSNRLATYESADDASERHLIAHLLNRYLGCAWISADNIFLTNGAQEAISIVCGYGAGADLAALMPLPLYYAYEQSSLRWGMPVAGYYGNTGLVCWNARDSRPLMNVVLLPNPVSGTVFSMPKDIPASPRLTLVDCVYQLGEHTEGERMSNHLRTLVQNFAPEQLALIFTISKDLCLPGLRAGLLVTGNQELLRYIRADRFERVYSVNPMIGQMLAFYLAVLELRDANRRGCPGSIYSQLRMAFSQAKMTFPSQRDINEILAYLDGMARHSSNNMATLQQANSPVRLDTHWLPSAGYSVFPRVGRRFACTDDFLAWIRNAGVRFRLKLNPACMFGGNPELWAALYPGQYRLRVNLSETAARLAQTISVLDGVLNTELEPSQQLEE